jgi:hypothetical protein
VPDAGLVAEFAKAWGPFGVLVLLMMFGLLVPVRTHNRELEQANRRGDDWKAAFDAADARNDAQQEQIGELLELARTSNALIQALHQTAQRGRDGRR